jgi:hypothetical protein
MDFMRRILGAVLVFYKRNLTGGGGYAWAADRITPEKSANRKLSPNLNPEGVAEANLRIARDSGVGRYFVTFRSVMK